MHHYAYFLEFIVMVFFEEERWAVLEFTHRWSIFIVVLPHIQWHMKHCDIKLSNINLGSMLFTTPMGLCSQSSSNKAPNKMPDYAKFCIIFPSPFFLTTPIHLVSMNAPLHYILWDVNLVVLLIKLSTSIFQCSQSTGGDAYCAFTHRTCCIEAI